MKMITMLLFKNKHLKKRKKNKHLIFKIQLWEMLRKYGIYRVDLKCCVSSVLQSESVIDMQIYTYTNIHSFVGSFATWVLTKQWVEFPVWYSRSSLIVYFVYTSVWYELPWWINNKKSTCNAGDVRSIPGSGRSPGERKWQPTPAFLPREFHGQRSLAGYSPWGYRRVGHK